MKQIFKISTAALVGCMACATAWADPVVYTLYALADVSLGSQSFAQQQVTVVFRGDTRNVSTQTLQGAPSYPAYPVYTNSRGTATVSFTSGATSYVAHIASGLSYISYDPTHGIIAFGSNASGLANSHILTVSDCNFTTCDITQSSVSAGLGQHQILSAIADVLTYPQDTGFYSPRALALPEDITHSTLLTGYSNECISFSWNPVCSTPTVVTLATDLGDFHLNNPDQTSDKALFTVDVGAAADD